MKRVCNLTTGSILIQTDCALLLNVYDTIASVHTHAHKSGHGHVTNKCFRTGAALSTHRNMMHTTMALSFLLRLCWFFFCCFFSGVGGRDMILLLVSSCLRLLHVCIFVYSKQRGERWWTMTQWDITMMTWTYSTIKEWEGEVFICLFVILLLCSPLDWLRRRGKKCLLCVSSEKGGGREREREDEWCTRWTGEWRCRQMCTCGAHVLI